MTTDAVTMLKEEYEYLKKKSEDLLLSLVKGLEDIKEGRIRPRKKVKG